MLLTVPKGHELLVSINYNGSDAYQFIPIEDFSLLPQRLPSGAVASILVESYETLRWSPIKFYPQEKEVFLYRYRSTGTKEYIYVNSEYKVNKSSFDYKLLSTMIRSKFKLMSSVVLSCKAIGHDVKVKDSSLYINGIHITKAFVKEFITELKNYISFRNLFPYDYIAFDRMIEDNVFTTLLISKNLNVLDLLVDDKIKVPFYLNKLFYFLFGKKYEIESYISDKKKKEPYGLRKDIKLRALRYHNRRKKIPGIGYEIHAVTGKPYLFVNGIPIMYMRYNKSNQPVKSKKRKRGKRK
jgi:hypothetical protein